MSKFKEGLIKIKSGVNTILSPITKVMEASTKPGGKLHAPKVGLKQIAEGVKHIFGRTDAQKTEALYENLLATVPDNKKEIIRQLFKNVDGYSKNSEQLLGKMSRIEYLSLVRDIFVKSAIGNFVGIQPMTGPVGISHFLRFISNEADVDGDEGKGSRVSLQIVNQTTTVGTRRLQARFTPEVVEDLAAYDVNVVKEFNNVLVQQIAADIDNEFFTDMCGAAKAVKQLESESLALTINKSSNDIARNTRRGAARFVIVSPESLVELQLDPKSNYVQTAEEGNDWSFKRVGKINSMSVFLTTLPMNGKALIGYKGGGMFNDEVDAGLMFCPYIPLVSSGVVIDPNTFQPQVTLMTRYGKSFISKEDMSNYYTLIE